MYHGLEMGLPRVVRTLARQRLSSAASHLITKMFDLGTEVAIVRLNKGHASLVGGLLGLKSRCTSGEAIKTDGDSANRIFM